MARIVKWFRRYAEVPGVSYEGSASVDRTRLIGHDFEPTAQEAFTIGGETRQLTTWPSVGSSGASPAYRRAFVDAPEDTSREDLLRRSEEALELPGTLTDYHLALHHFCETAYKRRKEDPSVFADVERFGLLDVELVENHREIIEYEPGKFQTVSAFGRLLALYEREGYLLEALEIAERGLACGQDLERKAEDLRGRVAALVEEEGGGYQSLWPPTSN